MALKEDTYQTSKTAAALFCFWFFLNIRDEMGNGGNQDKTGETLSAMCFIYLALGKVGGGGCF